MRTVCLMLSLVLLGGFAWGQEWEIEYLPELPGTSWSLAYAINNRGQVVGECRVNDASIPVLWERNEVYILPAPEGYEDAYATGINNSGIIIGTASHDEYGPIYDKYAGCVWNAKRELIAVVQPLQYTTLNRVDENGVVYGRAHPGTNYSDLVYFTWTQQGGITEIAHIERLYIQGIGQGGDMVGDLASHAVALKKTPGL